MAIQNNYGGLPMKKHGRATFLNAIFIMLVLQIELAAERQLASGVSAQIDIGLERGAAQSVQGRLI
jgi:hypothetical protein